MPEQSVIDRVSSFLEAMDVLYEVDQTEGVVYSVWGIRDRSFLVLVGSEGSWLWMRTRIVKLEDVPEESRAPLFESLLRIHGAYNEVRYEIGDDGYIGASKEIPLSGLNIENFKTGFISLIMAIRLFVDRVAPEHGIPEDRLGFG